MSVPLDFSSTTAPNSSDLVNSPRNCLDLTQDMDTIQQIGIDLCISRTTCWTHACGVYIPTPEVMAVTIT